MNLTDDSLSQLYTIPESDWSLINKGVKFVISSNDFRNGISYFLPSFPEMENVCQIWKSYTFPQIVQQSEFLNDYANQCTLKFKDLKVELDGTNDDEFLLFAEANSSIDYLYHTSISLSSKFHDLAKQIMHFREVVLVFDAQVLTYKDKLGSFEFWEPISHVTHRFEDITNSVLGKWQAITSDLEYIVSNQVDITTPLLIDLNIDVALVSWDRIQRETIAFTSMASQQQELLNG